MSKILQIWEDVVQPSPVNPTDPGYLIQPENLIYQGCFRLPAYPPDRYDFPTKGMCYNPANNSLFVVGFEGDHGCGEVTIPAPIAGAPNVASLNRASVIQHVGDPTGGGWTALAYGAGITFGGCLIHDSRLIVTYYRYYDGDGSQPFSHWSCNPNISTGSYIGPATLAVTDLVHNTQPHAGMVSGYMGNIAPAWQAAFGGPCFTGNSGISIITRTSFGPGAFAFDPTNIGVVNPVPTTPLVFYPDNAQTLGLWGDPEPNDQFNGTMQMGGIVQPENTGSVLFFGMLGLGRYAYGNGTADPALDGQPVPDEPGRFYVYDPAIASPGDHAYPYAARVWAYRAVDLAAVAAGTLPPWGALPYAVWTLPSDFYSFLPRLAGAAYDAATGRIFVLQTFDDGDAPLVHVYTLQQTGTTYALTVVNGTGSGTFTLGAVANIVANTPAPGFMFSAWTGDTGTIANVNAASTTLVMNAAKTVTATYAALPTYALTVTNGTGDGSYTAGTVVNIVADAPPGGQTFDRWTGAVTNVANIFASTTTITMPAGATGITATYTATPLYTLTVNSGTGDGNYAAGTVVAIVADSPAPGFVFSAWSGATVASSSSASTTLTMPAAATAVTANYVSTAGTTYYVAGDGSDSNNGLSTTTPFLTINHAVTFLGAQDILYIRGGTYAEALIWVGWPGDTLGTSWGTAITISAYPSETVIIQPPPTSSYGIVAQGSGPAATDAPRYIIFNNIIFDCVYLSQIGIAISAWPPASSGPPTAPAHHFRFVNCELKWVNAQQGFFTAWGSVGCEWLGGSIHDIYGPTSTGNNTQGINATGSDLLVDGAFIYNCWGYAISNASMVVGQVIDNHIIRNCFIYSCGLGHAGLGGINIPEGIGHQIYNNAILGCEGPGIALRYNPQGGSTGMQIYDNSITLISGEGIYINAAQTSTVVKNNIVYNVGGTNFVDLGTGTIATNNIFAADPLFVDAPSGNLQLLPGSPAINAGVGISFINRDITGLARPTSGACTAGAYEFTTTTPSSLPVVPGGYGFGMETRAAYGSVAAPVILRVTNINDSGAGSLRAALADTRPRVIIFEVSGTIAATTELVIADPYCTVAGQTAPAPGIMIKNYGLQIQTHDVLIQHLFVRPGADTCNTGVEAFITGNPYNIVLDHLSVSWSQSKNFALTNGTQDMNMSIWRCICSEALYNAPGRESCGGGGAGFAYGLLIRDSGKQVSVIQTLFTQCAERNPYCTGNSESAILNNYIYNFDHLASFLSDIDDVEPPGLLATFIGNAYKLGPTPEVDFNYCISSRFLKTSAQVYVDDTDMDPGSGVPMTEFVVIDGDDPIVGTPPVVVPDYVPMAASAVPAFVLANAGARTADDDSVDVRIKADVVARTGNFIATPADVGGYPTFAVNTRALTTPANPDSITGSGYTNLEVWLHGYADAVEG